MVVTESTYLTPKELALKLKIGRNKTYDLLKEPGFPAYRIGSEYRIPEDELLEWLNSQCRRQRGGQ
jgi:excisionase family DNA binding protein